MPAACTASMAIGLLGSITIASYFNTASAYGVLWPALREWLMEQGGVDTMWRALAWELEGACGGRGVRLSSGGIANARASMLLESVEAVMLLWIRCPTPLPKQPAARHSLMPADALLNVGDGIITLQLVLGKLLPAAFPAMQPGVRTKAIELAHRIGFLCCSGSPAAGSDGEKYPEPMHLPALRAWPYLVGAARYQISAVVQDSEERRNIQVRVGCIIGAMHGAWCMQPRVPLS